MLLQNLACDLQLTVVKPTSALLVGLILAEIDNGGLTCERQNRLAGLTEERNKNFNNKIVIAETIRKLNDNHFNQVCYRKRVNLE